MGSAVMNNAWPTPGQRQRARLAAMQSNQAKAIGRLANVASYVRQAEQHALQVLRDAYRRIDADKAQDDITRNDGP